MLLPSFAHAQLRTRTALDSMNAQANGFWFNLSYYQFEQQFPALQAIPPLSTGMDDEILFTYIILDSLMRTTIPPGMFNLSLWKDQSVKNDTINAMIKYLYKLIDYDPVRFNQYKHSLGSEYLLSLGGLESITHDLISRIVLNTPSDSNFLAFEDINGCYLCFS